MCREAAAVSNKTLKLLDTEVWGVDLWLGSLVARFGSFRFRLRKPATWDSCFIPPPRDAAAVLAALEGLYRLLGSCAMCSDPAILRTVRRFVFCTVSAEDSKSAPQTFLEGLEQELQQRDPETCWAGCRRVEVLGNRALQSTLTESRCRFRGRRS